MEIREKEYVPIARMENDYVVDNEGNIVYIPRLGMYFNFDNHSYIKDFVPIAYLIPCNSTKTYEYIYIKEHTEEGDHENKYEQGYEETLLHKSSDYLHNIYYRIDKLRELGYIAKDNSKQEDLCLFAKWKQYCSSGKMGELDIYTKSNKLRYTAKEINAVVAEYDKGGFSEYDGKY